MKFVRAVLPIAITVLVMVCSCQDSYQLSQLNSEEQHIYTKLSTAESGINFSNELIENLKFNGLQYEYYYNGSGLAVADFNNDGLKDIFFVSSLKEHAFYLNKGDLKFEDVSKATGIKNTTHFSGGVTVVDINNDGWMDLYISNSGKFKEAKTRENKLYINTGHVTKEGVPTFVERGKEYGLNLSDCSTQAAFFDYDRDGDLDVYILNHYPASYPTDVSLKEVLQMDGGVANDRLMRNDNGRFVDVSKEAGIIQNRMEYGLGIAVGDVNNDGWPDVYISNDYSGKDHLYINKANGSFVDGIMEATEHISFFSMGNDMADINNDGWLDVMTVDMMGENSYDIKTSMSGMNPKKFQEVVDLGLHHQYMYNALQINSGFLDANGVPKFSDVAQFSGVSSTDWSWGPLFFDMDNDGYKDLFVSNGIKRDFRNNDFVNYVNKKQDSIHEKQSFDPKKYIGDVLQKMPTRKKENYFFKNKGNAQFSKMNVLWGDGGLTSSNGAVYADLDNDGDLEIVVNNTDDPSFILKNNSVELGLGHYVTFQLVGDKANKDGVGARIVVTTEQGKQVQELYYSRGFMSASGKELHFGLGTSSTAHVEIVWPDGKSQVLENVAIDKLVSVHYKDAKLKENEAIEKVPALFAEQSLPIDYVHKENVYDDYERESLLPHKMSQEGPALAVADVNGDGLDDFYVGGAIGNAGALYVQQEKGDFVRSNEAVFAQHTQYEDVAAIMIDIDHDNDKDLYVVSGGNEYNQGSKQLTDRLYINNGKGQFTYLEVGLPAIAESGACVVPTDFDNDGDIDVFVGTRQLPGKYPASGASYILKNNGKKDALVRLEKVEVTDNGLFNNLGMVTDANWVDLDGDGFKDLVVVGEWMPITIIMNQGGKEFVDKTEAYGLSKTNGWWRSVVLQDFDGDGDMDIMAGNLGLNYKYKAQADAPFEVYGGDLDAAGGNDVVLGYYDNKKLVTVRGRECSSSQMPFIKKKYPTYDEFGNAGVKDIFTENQLQQAVHKQAYTFATTYLENVGGAFKARALPNEVQWSSVNSILVEDFNKDGSKDVLMVGNLYGSEVETPRNDASHGVLLLGNGKGEFTSVEARDSGVFLEGEAKHAQHIAINHKEYVLVALNNRPLKLLEML